MYGTSGIAKCIADVLRNDIVSVPASTIYNSNTNLISNIACTPTFAYTCLKDIILTGTSWAGYDWRNMVADYYGGGATGTRSVDVSVSRILKQEDGPSSGPHSNMPGAKFAEVNVYLKLADGAKAADIGRLKQAAMRIYRLLDYEYAVNTLRKPLYIPITDPTIDQRFPIYACWQGESAEKQAVTERDLGILFYVYYVDLTV